MTRHQLRTNSLHTGARRRVLLMILIGVFVVASAGVTLAKKKPAIKASAQPEQPKFSEEAILSPTLIDVMHEIFRHYVTAGVAFGQGNYSMAIAHLDVTLDNLDLIEGLVPDKDNDGKPVDKKAFVGVKNELVKNLRTVRSDIAGKRYRSARQMAPEKVTQLCIVCHESVQVPSPWPSVGE